MLNVSATGKLDDGRYVVSVSTYRNPNNQLECYAVKGDKVDQFIKERRGLDTLKSLHKGLVAATACISGVFAAYYTKSNAALKGVVGIIAGVGIFAGLNAIDKGINNMAMKNMLNRNEAEDLTDKMTKNNQQN